MGLFDWLTWANVVKLVESNFMTALLGAAAGAGFGALAADRIARRSRSRERLLQEIQNTNTALGTLLAAFSTFSNIKEQHTRDLLADYRQKRALVHQADAERQRTGRPPAQPLELAINMRMFDEVRVRIERIEEVVGKLTIRGRPLAVLAMLGQELATLKHLMQRYNQLTIDIQSLPNDEQQIRYIYGLRQQNSRTIDTTFGDVLEGCASANDDCMYFSWRLCEDIHQHGMLVRKMLLRSFKGPVPTIDRVVFDDPKEKGLMPSPENYPTWENNFYWQVPPTPGRRAGKLKYVIKRRWRRFWRLPWSRKIERRKR